MHSAAFEAITDALERQVGGQRAVISGGGHAPQEVGDVFNALLEGFLTQPATIDGVAAREAVRTGR